MTITRRGLAAGATLLAATAAQAQTGLAVVSEGPATRPVAREFVVRSKAGRQYLIQVAAPIRPLRPGEKVAALYILDGNGAFGLASDNAAILNNAGLMAPAYVVAVGYPNPLLQSSAAGRMTGSMRRTSFSPVLDSSVKVEFGEGDSGSCGLETIEFQNLSHSCSLGLVTESTQPLSKGRPT